jgi:hypothetical protein
MQLTLLHAWHIYLLKLTSLPIPITPLTDFMGFISALSDNRTPQKPSGKKLNNLCCSSTFQSQ